MLHQVDLGTIFELREFGCIVVRDTDGPCQRRPRRLQIIGYYSKQRPSASGDVSHIWSRAAPLPTVP